MSPERLASIEALLRAIPVSWELMTLPDGELGIRIPSPENGPSIMRVTRESAPAAASDVDLIGNAPADVESLLAHLRGQRRCAREELDAIERRLSQASRSPWKAFLSSKGGVGGDTVIWVSESDDEPDLYLWIDDAPAPDAVFEFVAAMRQALPELLVEARRSP